MVFQTGRTWGRWWALAQQHSPIRIGSRLSSSRLPPPPHPEEGNSLLLCQVGKCYGGGGIRRR